MYISFKFTASLTVDTWSHTARASCKRKSSSSVLCHGLGNASFCGCYRSGSHCRSKHQTSHSRPPSVQAKPENLKWKYLGRVSTNMANDHDGQSFYKQAWIISNREFLDLSRNQKLLKQLVTRRGLPVLDNILTGLQKIKGIVAGEGPCDLPQSQSIGSRLMWVVFRTSSSEHIQ